MLRSATSTCARRGDRHLAGDALQRCLQTIRGLTLDASSPSRSSANAHSSERRGMSPVRRRPRRRDSRRRARPVVLIHRARRARHRRRPRARAPRAGPRRRVDPSRATRRRGSLQITDDLSSDRHARPRQNPGKDGVAKATYPPSRLEAAHDRAAESTRTRAPRSTHRATHGVLRSLARFIWEARVTKNSPRPKSLQLTPARAWCRTQRIRTLSAAHRRDDAAVPPLRLLDLFCATPAHGRGYWLPPLRGSLLAMLRGWLTLATRLNNFRLLIRRVLIVE